MKKVKISSLSNKDNIGENDFTLSIGDALRKIPSTYRGIVLLSELDLNIAATNSPPGLSVVVLSGSSINAAVSGNGILIQFARGYASQNLSISRRVFQLQMDTSGIYFRIVAGSASGLIFNEWRKIQDSAI